MTLSAAHRRSTPIALALFVSFGCATVRAPASTIGDEVHVGANGAQPQVELWLESGEPITEAEKAKAVAQVREALDRATATLVTEDEETLLVVRAQGVARTGSQKANQTAAKVGIVLGAVAIVAVVVAAVVAGGKGGGHGSVPKLGGGAFKASAPRIAPHAAGAFKAAPPRFGFAAAGARVRVHPVPVLVGAELRVPVVVDGSAGPPLEQGDAPLLGEPGPEERTAFPPAEPMKLQLPPPPPLDPSGREFFDKDYTRLDLIVVDRATGLATWEKWVEGNVDPRDPKAVRALLAGAIQDGAGWVQLR